MSAIKIYWWKIRGINLISFIYTKFNLVDIIYILVPIFELFLIRPWFFYDFDVSFSMVHKLKVSDSHVRRILTSKSKSQFN